VKVLIVDDEKPARDRLRQLVDDSEGHVVVGEAANGEQALTEATTQQPDVVLLDIRMPGMDGIETAHHLNAMEHPPAVVFTTAYDEYAIDAFDARAIGYVLKPVRREKLERALEHAMRLSGTTLREITSESKVDSRRHHVCTGSRGELHLIPIKEIDSFNADQKYVCVHHSGGQDLIDDSLKSLEQEFADSFVRIHRAALVAVDQIDRLEKLPTGKTRVVLRSGSQQDDNELIISRRHLTDVRRRLKGG
jgi:two-component system, LytTR family, response regulator AlgR